MPYSTQNLVVGENNLFLTVFVTNNESDFSRSTIYLDGEENIIGNKFEQFSDTDFILNAEAIPYLLVSSLEQPIIVDGVITGYQEIGSYRASATDPLEDWTYNYDNNYDLQWGT
jgi:hypothetical protein